MSELIAAAAVAVAIVGLMYARSSAAAADRAATAAEDAHQLAKKSAEAALRSAEAAEKANILTKAEAEKRDEERLLSLKTTVVPVTQFYSGDYSTPGLFIKNMGKSAASDIKAFVVARGFHRELLFKPLLAGEESKMSSRKSPSQSEGKYFPAHQREKALVRLFWTNEDGSAGITDWVELPIGR